jgi:hypothetical protein
LEARKVSPDQFSLSRSPSLYSRVYLIVIIDKSAVRPRLAQMLAEKEENRFLARVIANFAGRKDIKKTARSH